MIDNKIDEDNISINTVCELLMDEKYCYLQTEQVKALLNNKDYSFHDWGNFARSWNSLITDQYMADGGSYRKSRHATLSALPYSKIWQREAHQPHYQTLHYNSLNGGIARHYEPILATTMDNVSFTSVIALGCEIFGRLSPSNAWHIEAHQFRIEAHAKKKSEPTPEGIHRDGVNFVIILMINRDNIDGGNTCIYDLNKNKINEFTMKSPLSMALFDDQNIFHGITSVKQLNPNEHASRDVLVVTFKKKVSSEAIDHG